MPQSIEIIAHRGFSAAAPENTLSALEAALEAGADAVEFDLHTAACGTPVLFHDAMLSRTTNGVGPLRRRTLEQLKALDAGRWFSPAFAGERIPSFAEALERLRGRVGRVYAEMKGFRELEDLDRMVHIARDAGMLDIDDLHLDELDAPGPHAGPAAGPDHRLHRGRGGRRSTRPSSAPPATRAPWWTCAPTSWWTTPGSRARARAPASTWRSGPWTTRARPTRPRPGRAAHHDEPGGGTADLEAGAVRPGPSATGRVPKPGPTRHP